MHVSVCMCIVGLFLATQLLLRLFISKSVGFEKGASTINIEILTKDSEWPQMDWLPFMNESKSISHRVHANHMNK